MRTIKFRGKCLDSGTWVYGSLFDRIWRNSADGSRVCYIFPDNMLDDDNGGGDSWEDFAEVAEEYEVDPATLGQYTGLKDKNGKEIYEGDILANGGIPGRVEWDSLLLQFHCAWANFDFKTSGDIFYLLRNNYVAIGNIHDNPDLLKEANDDE